MEDIASLLPWIGFMFFVLWVLITYAIPKIKRYRRRNRMLDEIDDKYESLRKTRKDLIYHIDWAHDRGDHRQANELELEIERIDKELEELRVRFNELQNSRGDISKKQ